LFFNNGLLDDLERAIEKGEPIGWASIFGGTSIYRGEGVEESQYLLPQ